MGTLDDLHSSVEEKGFKLKRTVIFYRVIPAALNHKVPKRHVNAVLVRLLKPRNGFRKNTQMAISS